MRSLSCCRHFLHVGFDVNVLRLGLIETDRLRLRFGHHGQLGCRLGLRLRFLVSLARTATVLSGRFCICKTSQVP